MSEIGMERCCCGHPSCQTWWLTGIGSFVQSSGFTKPEAERIVAALQSDAGELAQALIACLLLIDDMMPGVRHIALQNYALLNDAPLAAKRALLGTTRTPEDRALQMLEVAWANKKAVGRRADILLALRLIVRQQRRGPDEKEDKQ
jgi:hypothetical protein